MAIVVLLLLHIPPPPPVSVVVAPGHTFVVPVIAGGKVLTVTTIVTIHEPPSE